ncbi:MAG: ABC transporter ATP-binding protein/permease [Proteobacteria bacterium]|nr:ABC transporter ATP-binding protein/permease [Pseudomonadota bacterium]MBU1595498.1 ABC transporter ATP-binding protein/permease [Pseudomonadota bacterium]
MTDHAPDSSLVSPAGGSLGTKKRFLRQVLRLAGPYWHCERRVKVRGATLLLLLLTMAQVGLAVWGNYWNRALYDALEQRSVRGVMIQVAIFALIMASSLAITAAHLMVKRWLQIDWRAWLTEQLVGNWMGNAHHYRLLFTPGEHDNPDQRISEDIRIATESAIALAHSLTFSLLILGLFINILWTVSGAVDIPGFNIHVPGYMVPLAFLYAGIGSAFGWMIGRPLVRTTNALQTAEATFRFGLSRAREHAEAIALMRGEPRERAGSSTRFGQVMRDWNRQSLAYMGLVSFGTVYGSLLPVLPILIAAPQYIFGAMTLGALMQSAQAFQQLTSSLSWPVDSIGEIARCRASADRVLSLYEDMQLLDDKTQASAHPQIALDTSDSPRLTVEDLCIAEPSGRILMEHFSVEIRRGERVLITGDPAVTSGLFKVIGGLWPWGSGRVWLPGDGEMLFMAQRPFLPEGTLREAICYPRPADAFAEPQLLHALGAVGLTRLSTRLDEQDNWEQALPPRAQQQLGFARVLLQQPAWIFMDEATDAFDPEGERQILEMLCRELPDATLLTISFHPDLGKLHQRTLSLSRASETKLLFGDRRHGNGAPHE